MAQHDWQGEMRKGIAEMCVLSALAKEETYGYQIIQNLEMFETITMRESTLYLILARLERDRLVTTRKVASTKGPKRKYFALTPQGRERLVTMRQFWGTYSKDVTRFLKQEPTP